MTHCFTDEELHNLMAEVQKMQDYLDKAGIDVREAGVLDVREAIMRCDSGVPNVRYILKDEEFHKLSQILDHLQTELHDTDAVGHVEDAVRILESVERDVSL